jgi:hypothetical protein
MMVYPSVLSDTQYLREKMGKLTINSRKCFKTRDKSWTVHLDQSFCTKEKKSKKLNLKTKLFLRISLSINLFLLVLYFP